MSLITRQDGSQYPDDDADDATLSEENASAVRTDGGYAYHRTISNLVIDLLGGGDLAESDDASPENWQTLENAMLATAALEVKAIAVAHEYEDSAGDSVDEFTHDEITRMLATLARRLEAGRELAKRFRRARWGHPAFGGGEGWEAKQAEAEAKPEKAQAAE